MLKYIGVFILSASISAYGSFLSSSIKGSCSLRKEVLQLLKDIERAIKYGNGQIIEIVRNCKSPYLTKCGFCTSIYNTTNAETAIATTLSALSEKDMEMLTDYFSKLGKTAFTELELKNCTYYIDYFEKTQNEYEKEVETKSLLYKKLGLIIGILTAIIFI